MTDPTRWVISPTDGRIHSLPPVGDHPPARVLQVRCGQLLPVGVPQHDHLPGWQLCVSCLYRYLMPTGVFPPQSPVRHRSEGDDAPPGGFWGGQLGLTGDAGADSLGCSGDQR